MTTERKDAKMLRAYSRLGKWNRELSARLVSWPLIEIPDMSESELINEVRGALRVSYAKHNFDLKLIPDFY